MKLFIGLLQKCKTIGHRNKSFGWFAAFWSCFCIVQQCWAKAVALCREAAGAIDLGASQVLHCSQIRSSPVVWEFGAEHGLKGLLLELACFTGEESS